MRSFQAFANMSCCKHIELQSCKIASDCDAARLLHKRQFANCKLGRAREKGWACRIGVPPCCF